MKNVIDQDRKFTQINFQFSILNFQFSIIPYYLLLLISIYSSIPNCLIFHFVLFTIYQQVPEGWQSSFYVHRSSFQKAINKKIISSQKNEERNWWRTCKISFTPINFQSSIINPQLSILNYQFSIFNYYLLLITYYF